VKAKVANLKDLGSPNRGDGVKTEVWNNEKNRLGATEQIAAMVAEIYWVRLTEGQVATGTFASC
jgi:hypothetical protein